jgi:hypothetical protein
LWITVVATGIGGRSAGRRSSLITASSGDALEAPSFLRGPE